MPLTKEEKKEYDKRRYEKNKEKIKEKAKQKYLENKQKFNSASKKYYEENKEKMRACAKEWNEENKEYMQKYYRDYRIKNQERISQQRAEKYKENKEKIRLKRKENIAITRQKERQRVKNDPQFHMAKRLRAGLNKKLRKYRVDKVDKTLNLLGCNTEFFVKYLESKFEDGMSWDNRHLWHIDHTIPCASFDLIQEEEQRKCFHYTNLQPLWASDNMSKSDLMPEEWELKKARMKKKDDA
jgi:hypothetical protein